MAQRTSISRSSTGGPAVAFDVPVTVVTTCASPLGATVLTEDADDAISGEG